ncbi:MAG: response regulator [Elusimicrobia bacterium]|nr:response regulator [Elusimicrobiota bacterium]
MPHKILVVDDESDYLNIAAAILGSEGYSVLKAATGAEGLRKAVADKPALIVLDIGLPDISGLDVNRRLKKDPSTAGIPVLLFTVRSELDLVKKALQEGAAEYIIKPFDPDRLIQTVKKHLKK